MDFLLGLDIGTSSLKAVAYDPVGGRVVAQAAEPTPQTHSRAEWTEYDPALIWQLICRCTRRVVAALPAGAHVAGVAAASMGEAGVPLDRAGDPLYPIIAWHDPRSEPQAQLLRREVGGELIHRITGQQVRHVFAAAKLLWLRQNAPDVIRRLALWLSMEDYALWRLSGIAATDYSIASRTMLFDQTTGDWSPTMLGICGIAAEALPRPHPSATVIGHVTAEAAQQTGLAEGTPVVTGGHDHLCGALAAGAVETGRFLDSSGTAQSMLMPIERFHGGDDVYRAGFSCYRHVLRRRYMIQGGLNTAGAALEWVVKLGGVPPEGSAPARGVEALAGHPPEGSTSPRGVEALAGLAAPSAYDELMREAERSGPGARGIFCLPHFRGSTTPINDAASRAAFIGLHLSHTRGDMLRAVIEGLAYYLRSNLERMAQVGPAAPGYMLAIGGANRHPLVLQVKADVCNRPVVTPTVPEAVAVGAALLAGLAVGVFSDEAQAAAGVHCDAVRYEPDAQRAALYETWYNGTYIRLYDAMKHLQEDSTHALA